MPSKRQKLQVVWMIGFLAIMFSGCREAMPPEPPAIYGVEEGMVYGTGVLIDVRTREEDVVYTAEINGQSFPLGEVFEEEGIHGLIVTARRAQGKQTAASEVSFEIDKEPPPVPEITGVESGKIYHGGIVVYVLEEEGISYFAKINEGSYNFGEVYHAEGEHTLWVHALKERNGLTSARELPFSIDKDRYMQDEIDYLLEIAFGGEFGGDPKHIKKWTGDLRVEVIGKTTEWDLNTLTKIMDEIMEITDEITLQISDNKPNFHVHFIPHKEFIQHADAKIAKENWGLFFYYEDNKGRITGAKVLIASDKPDDVRAHLLREEFTQALGLAQDSWEYPESIFYQGWTTGQEFAEIDRRLLQMLYHPDIHPNMQKNKVQAYFEKKKADVNTRVQIFPVDQGKEVAAFLQFRNEVLLRIEERDLDYILTHVDPEFFYHPLSARGLQAFHDYFSLDTNPEESNLWEVLKEALLLGGIFLDQERTIYETPYLKSRFPKGFDPYNHKVVIGRDIPIHEKPNAASRIIGLLRFDVIRWLPAAPVPVLPDDPVTGESFQWEYIETLNGLKGYVQTAHLRRPLAYTVTFEQKEGRWMIISITS